MGPISTFIKNKYTVPPLLDSAPPKPQPQNLSCTEQCQYWYWEYSILVKNPSNALVCFIMILSNNNVTF